MPDGEDDEDAMRTIATLGRENAALRARLGALADEAERLAGMVARLAKERDALIEGCITTRSRRSELGIEYGVVTARSGVDWHDTHTAAVAAVRRAAGLEPES